MSGRRHRPGTPGQFVRQLDRDPVAHQPRSPRPSPSARLSGSRRPLPTNKSLICGSGRIRTSRRLGKTANDGAAHRPRRHRRRSVLGYGRTGGWAGRDGTGGGSSRRPARWRAGKRGVGRAAAGRAANAPDPRWPDLGPRCVWQAGRAGSIPVGGPVRISGMPIGFDSDGQDGPVCPGRVENWECFAAILRTAFAPLRPGGSRL